MLHRQAITTIHTRRAITAPNRANKLFCIRRSLFIHCCQSLISRRRYAQIVICIHMPSQGASQLANNTIGQDHGLTDVSWSK